MVTIAVHIIHMVYNKWAIVQWGYVDGTHLAIALNTVVMVTAHVTTNVK